MGAARGIDRRMQRIWTRFGALRRGTPRAVWWLTALFVALGTWWSVIVPLGLPPDEPAHVDLTMAVAASGSFPDYDDRTMSVASLTLRYPTTDRHADGGPRLAPETVVPRSERRTYTERGGDRPASWALGPGQEVAPLANQMPQHGPLYYSVAAASLRVGRLVSGGEAVLGREVLGLRLLGVAMTAHLPLAAFWAARRLGASDHGATAAAVMPLFVPQLSHVTAAVSYTPLLIGLSAIVAVSLAGVVRGDGRRSTALAVGGVTALAMWTTASAFLLLPWVVIAYASQLRRWSPAQLRRSIGGAATAVGVALGAGGFWWIRNVVKFGTPTPSTDSEHYASLTPRPGFDPDPSLILELAQDWMPVRFFGAFGTSFSATIGDGFVTGLLLIAGVGALAAAVPRRFGRPDGLTTIRVAAFAVPFAILLAFVLYRSWDLYQMSGSVTFLQGRYLFGAFIPFAVVVGTGWFRVGRRAAAPALLVVAAAVHVEATRAVLDTWWDDPGSSIRRSLASVSRWNAWFDRLPHLLLAAIGLLLVVAAVDLVRQAPTGRRVQAVGSA